MDCSMGNMNSQSPKAEPDPDTIKMFVGQIPRSMDENDLRKMFEEYGPVYQLNVLRDKITGQSKGCCFVTFYHRKSALEAQNALHNIKTMPGMQHPIQMKPADSEKRNAEERKLFIGMLSKKCNENDIRMMFSPFGQIEECTVLREQNGQSKGCAFVTYTSKQCTQNAIKAMHHSQTMEGCRSPLVVKYADTQKDKEMKKLQQMNASLVSMANLAGLGALANPQLLSQALGGAGAGNLGGLSNLGNLGSGLNALQLQQILAAASAAANALQNNPGDTSSLQALQSIQGLAALASLASASGGTGSAAGGSAGGSAGGGGGGGSGAGLGNLGLQNLAVLNQLVGNTPGGAAASLGNLSSPADAYNFTGTSNTSNSSPGLGQGNLGLPQSLQGMNGLGSGAGSLAAAGGGGATSNQDTLSQAYSGMQQYAASFPNAFSTQIQQAAANSPAGKQSEGPDGANLFIYHLPQEFADHDLMQMFLPFGTVVSAKVFIDKQTNLSKCFGFVSYDNPLSAQAAIQSMNGFQIGMKRLKVQLKRPKSDAKPY